MTNFSSKNRLVSKAEFQSVFSNAKKSSHQFLIALYRPNNLPYARLGLTIKKTIIKQSVKRNLIRRLLRESFREHQMALVGFDIVVLLRGKVPPIDRKVWREAADTLWTGIK